MNPFETAERFAALWGRQGHAILDAQQRLAEGFAGWASPSPAGQPASSDPSAAEPSAEAVESEDARADGRSEAAFARSRDTARDVAASVAASLPDAARETARPLLDPAAWDDDAPVPGPPAGADLARLAAALGAAEGETRRAALDESVLVREAWMNAAGAFGREVARIAAAAPSAEVAPAALLDRWVASAARSLVEARRAPGFARLHARREEAERGVAAAKAALAASLSLVPRGDLDALRDELDGLRRDVSDIVAALRPATEPDPAAAVAVSLRVVGKGAADDRDAGDGPSPVLLVPPLPGTAVLPFDADAVAQALAEAGLAVIRFEWGAAPRGGLAEAVRRLGETVRILAATKAGVPGTGVRALGLGEGGIPLLCLAAGDGADLASVALAATPVDARAYMAGPAGGFVWDDDGVAEAGDAGLLSAGRAVSPVAELLARHGGGDVVGAAPPPSPDQARLVAAWRREILRENRLLRGRLVLDGRPVDLARLRCPLLVLAPEADPLRPPEAFRAVRHLVASRRYREAPAWTGPAGLRPGPDAVRSLASRLVALWAEEGEERSRVRHHETA